MKFNLVDNVDELHKAEAVLATADPILGKLIESQKLVPRKPRSDYFASLCSSIISQQVSVAAARAIYTRFESITKLDPEIVIGMSDEQVKEVGLSRQKTSYIKDLAGHFHAKPEIYNHLETQDDEAVIEELTAVKGIGRWTAQMFLMFTLVRPDVFAPDDIGLQRAMKELYGWENVPPKKELEATAEKWSPYLSIASLHLWQSLNNEPVS